MRTRRQRKRGNAETGGIIPTIKKKKVDDKVARKVLQMIDKYRKSQDKQNVVNYIAKSEKNLMSFASGKAKDSEMDPEAKRKKLLGIK